MELTFEKKRAKEFLDAINRHVALQPGFIFIPDAKPQFERYWTREDLVLLAAVCMSSVVVTEHGSNFEQAEAKAVDLDLMLDCWWDLAARVANNDYPFADKQPCIIKDDGSVFLPEVTE
jgi:hypothetical protein